MLIRQRPGTASGIVFETLEDETGIMNLIVKPDIYERYRPPPAMQVCFRPMGIVQRQGQVVHVIAKRLFDLSELTAGVIGDCNRRDFHLNASPIDARNRRINYVGLMTSAVRVRSTAIARCCHSGLHGLRSGSTWLPAIMPDLLMTAFVESCVGDRRRLGSGGGAPHRAGAPCAAKLLRLLADKKNILVTTHRHPDPDALASGVALCTLLRHEAPATPRSACRSRDRWPAASTKPSSATPI